MISTLVVDTTVSNASEHIDILERNLLYQEQGLIFSCYPRLDRLKLQYKDSSLSFGN